MRYLLIIITTFAFAVNWFLIGYQYGFEAGKQAVILEAIE